MDNRQSRLSSIAVAVLLILLAGCGTSADITIRNSHIISGTIVSSDARAVYIDTDDGNRTVPRDQISDIDHPGNGVGTLGAILVGYGIANIAVAAPNCDKNGSAFCVGVFTPAVLGAALVLWGFSVYAKSVSASRPHVRSDLSHLRLSPTYVFDSKSGGPGLALARSF